MKTIYKYKTEIILSVLLAVLLSSCEIEEPWTDPVAGFEIQYTDPATAKTEILEEPYTLIAGESYSFVATGSGNQNVFWYGTPGDSIRIGGGSDFNDRGKNQFSKGWVATEGTAKWVYNDAGTYTVVHVASSYTYSDDKYVEATSSKEVTVVEP